MASRRPRGRTAHAHRIQTKSSRRPRGRRAAPYLLALAVAGIVIAARTGSQPAVGLPFDLAAAGGHGPQAQSSLGPAAGPAGRSLDPAVDASGDPGANGSPIPVSPAGYRWPLVHARITQAFGPSSAGTFFVNGRRFHDGIDIASFCGDRVVAAHDGVVLSAGRHGVDAELGWVGDLARYYARLDAHNLWYGVAVIVVVDDGDGYRSLYAHFAKVVVKAGQVVDAGDLLGYEGRTGYASGCHVHFGLFDPNATATFETDPAIVKRTFLPPLEVARIDPLLVLPSRTTADIVWGWGQHASSAPSGSATPTP